MNIIIRDLKEIARFKDKCKYTWSQYNQRFLPDCQILEIFEHEKGPVRLELDVTEVAQISEFFSIYTELYKAVDEAARLRSLERQLLPNADPALVSILSKLGKIVEFFRRFKTDQLSSNELDYLRLIHSIPSPPPGLILKGKAHVHGAKTGIVPFPGRGPNQKL